MKAFNIAFLLFCSSSTISLAFQSVVLLSSAKSKHHKITSCGVMCLSSDNDDCLDHNPYMDESTYDKNHRYIKDPISRNHNNSRRSFLSSMTIAATSINFPSLDEPSSSFTSYYTTANAAETIGKDESCNDSTCLGVWDGLLGKQKLIVHNGHNNPPFDLGIWF